MSRPNADGQPLLWAKGVTFAYHDHGPAVLRQVDLALHRGDLVGLVGPNGSGKTTLLKVLSGLHAPQGGEVYLGGGRLRTLSRRQIGQRIAVVPQELQVPFSFTAREIVSMGRTPHMRPWLGETAADRAVVERVMEATETVEIAERPFNELSGGEQQRVIIGMALAQEPEVLLLDEPTVHLDINHQVEILELLVQLNRRRDLTVLATMHDLNLAALYFDRLVMLNGGRIVAEGTPEEVLRAERIADVFQAKVQVQPHPTRPRPQVVVLPLLPFG